MGADADGIDNVVRITVNTAFTAGDDATDTIAAAAAGIYDLADLAAGPTAVALTISPDTTPPTIIARTTRDMDGNGQIDRIELTFDENIDDSTANPLHFTVAAPYAITGVDTGGGGDDTQFFLTLSELATPDTGATPDVTYAQGTLADLSLNLLASSWWDVLWLNRTKITFDNTASTEDLVDFPVLVSLTATEVNFGPISSPWAPTFGLSTTMAPRSTMKSKRGMTDPRRRPSGSECSRSIARPAPTSSGSITTNRARWMGRMRPACGTPTTAACGTWKRPSPTS